MITHLAVLELIERLFPTQYYPLSKLYSDELESLGVIERFSEEQEYMLNVYASLQELETT